MQQALIITDTNDGWSFRAPAPLPIEALVLGKPVEQVANLLPRLFNLCGGAQGMGARLAFGLPMAADDRSRHEILRDHLLKLCIIWPSLLAMKPVPLPKDITAPGPLILPGPKVDFFRWLKAGQGVAAVLCAIARAFTRGEAVAHLPLMQAETAFDTLAQDNSVAARNASSPAMQTIATRYGRGPFWRAAALIFDLMALLQSPLQPLVCADGTVVVPAARGAYALRARSISGLVTGFSRRTPTDHLCAAGGVLQLSLTSLPPSKAHLLPLLIDILSPCVTVQLPQVHHA
jgi:hypothetical protein